MRRSPVLDRCQLLALLLFYSPLHYVPFSHAFSEERVITNFARPEDLSDIPGTPYILVTEFGEFRNEVGSIVLLDTTTDSRISFTNIAAAPTYLSAFADPTCEPRLPTLPIAPQGTDVLQVDVGTWEVAVINHNSYESVEFYLLTLLGTSSSSSPTLQTAGCTARALLSGDAHNDVAYSLDGSRLFCTLWFSSYSDGILDQLGVLRSFFAFARGKGALKEISVGGTAAVVQDDLNGANGLLFVDLDRVLVAENSDFAITEVNPSNGAVRNVLDIRMPDNIVRESDTSMLVTRMDVPFTFRVLPCTLLGLFCDLPFSVVRYDWITQEQSDVYSSTLNGMATVALTKNGNLYIGNVLTNHLMVVET